MKRFMLFILAAALLPVIPLMARDHQDFHGDNNAGSSVQAPQQSGGGQEKPDSKVSNQEQRPQTPARSQSSGHVKQAQVPQQPVVINMNRPSSGGHNRNYPAQQQKNSNQQINNEPSYGTLQWNPVKRTKQQFKQPVMTQKQGYKPGAATPQQNVRKSFQASKSNTASVIHHHPYEPNYVRKKLQNLGVKSAPSFITKREEVIHTDREHSRITLPTTGFDKHSLHAQEFSPRHFNDKAVHSQMSIIVGASWQGKIRDYNHSENIAGRYYWHNDKNFNYCHYIDNSGYHWYGWYAGDRCFWTRNFNNRWWMYDSDFDRWCFWNNGFWWWQDPYHLGDLYLYNETDYIPCNSAQDSIAVTVPEDVSSNSFISADKTRTVKLVSDTQDAFLYDTSEQPAFNPVYLASGVKEVIYSDTSNGKPLEIILKLNDGTFDMFDGLGNPYNSQVYGEAAAPSDNEAPPINSNPPDNPVK
jgi:hypothetical protein